MTCLNATPIAGKEVWFHCMARRHQSLIALSHQHQHALALALIIRRRFGIEKGETRWHEEIVEKIEGTYKAELKAHFEVEESVLFPEMERQLGKLELVAELVRDHANLRALVKQCAGTGGTETLDEFSALLEAHVRKEERRLFPEFEKRMPADEAFKIGQEIESRLLKVCPACSELTY